MKCSERHSEKTHAVRGSRCERAVRGSGNYLKIICKEHRCLVKTELELGGVDVRGQRESDEAIT